MAASKPAESSLRRALENELPEAEEPRSKRTKGKRQWSGKLPSSATPIRAGTETKTPIRHRQDVKAERAERLVEELDEQMVDMTEQMKNLRIHVNQLQHQLEESRDDQHAYRVQQLWALKAQIREQREKASREQCIVGWPSEATAKQRTEFVEWCLTQASLESKECQISHGIKPNQLSPMTLLTFKQAWMKIQLDKWYRDEYVAKKRSLHYYQQGMSTNDIIKMRPQIAVWDRIKGEPLKICLKAMDMACADGALKLDMNKLRPWWGHNAVYDEYDTYIWVHFSVRDVLATVYMDESVYQQIADRWEEASKRVRQGNADGGREQAGQKAAGKGGSKGKRKPFDTVLGEYPFEYKLAKVKDWNYDENVRAHQKDDQEDL